MAKISLSAALRRAARWLARYLWRERGYPFRAVLLTGLVSLVFAGSSGIAMFGSAFGVPVALALCAAVALIAVIVDEIGRALRSRN